MGNNIIWKFLKLITCSVSLLNLARIMFYYRSNALWMMQRKQLTTAQQRWAWSEMREIKKNKSMMMMKSVKRKESGQQTPIYWSLPSIGLHIIHCMLTLLPFPYVRAVIMLSIQARAQTIKSWSAILISSKSTCSQLCVYTIYKLSEYGFSISTHCWLKGGDGRRPGREEENKHGKKIEEKRPTSEWVQC